MNRCGPETRKFSRFHRPLPGITTERATDGAHIPRGITTERTTDRHRTTERAHNRPVPRRNTPVTCPGESNIGGELARAPESRPKREGQRR